MIGFDLTDRSEEFQKYYEVAMVFLDQFKKTVKDSGGSVNALEKSKIGGWVKPIRDLYVIDQVKGESIKLVYNNLPKDDFWSLNILSTSKLRKQFNTLVVKYAAYKKSNTVNSKAIY
jgi:hypothetical protein